MLFKYNIAGLGSKFSYIVSDGGKSGWSNNHNKLMNEDFMESSSGSSSTNSQSSIKINPPDAEYASREDFINKAIKKLNSYFKRNASSDGSRQKYTTRKINSQQ